MKVSNISPELKEKLERLAAESGLETQDEFIEHLLALYELKQLRVGNGIVYAKQIEELEYHTRRGLELFISMINTEAAERIELSKRHDKTLGDRAATIVAQELIIIDLQKARKQQSEELARLRDEISKLKQQLKADDGKMPPRP